MIAQAFYYMFNEYRLTNTTGTQMATVSLYSQHFAATLREQRVAITLQTRWMANDFDGFTPDALENLCTMTSVTYVPVLMDAERVDEERMIIDA